MGARKRARHVDELTRAAGCCRSQHQNIKRLFSSTSREADKRTGWRGADRRYRSADLQKGEEYRWQKRGICVIH